MNERDFLAQRFEAQRTRLRAVSYRMLGSLSEADDAVQEAWLRLSRSEASAVENLGGLTSEFLRIEIKTDAPDRASLNGRFAPFDGNRRSGLEKVEFDNSQLRATRIISGPDGRLSVLSPPRQPSLIVVIAGAGEISKGQTFWLGPGESKEFTNGQSGDLPQIELLRFDFKTKPKKS